MTTTTETRPRRIRGEGGFSQRASDGLWVGTLDLGWVNGKRVRKTVSAKTKREAQAKFLQLKKDADKGVISTGATVEAWLNHWLDTIAVERVRPRTLVGYRQYVNGYMIPAIGQHRLTKLSEDHVRALLRSMKDQGRSDQTRRQCRAILRRALTVAIQEGRVNRNVAANIDPPPDTKNHRLPLSLAQARQVLGSLDGNPLAARWIAALLQGLRQGECLGLKWQDIDMEAGTIRIERELLRITGQGMCITPTKSVASRRSIPMLEPMALALSQTERRGDFVFYGEAKDSRQDWQAWKELLVSSGVCDASMAFGEMPELAAGRTTTSTLLRDAKVDPTVIRDILGHSQVATTQEYYQRTSLDQMKVAMAALEASVKPVKPVKVKRVRARS